ERSIEMLIELWTSRWGDHKGDDIRAIQQNLRIMLRHYFDLGILYLPVLWKGERPIGVHACLVDVEKRVMHFFIGARDEIYAGPKPGLILHAHSIRQAIEMG